MPGCAPRRIQDTGRAVDEGEGVEAGEGRPLAGGRSTSSSTPGAWVLSRSRTWAKSGANVNEGSGPSAVEHSPAVQDVAPGKAVPAEGRGSSRGRLEQLRDGNGKGHGVTGENDGDAQQSAYLSLMLASGPARRT